MKNFKRFLLLFPFFATLLAFFQPYTTYEVASYLSIFTLAVIPLLIFNIILSIIALYRKSSLRWISILAFFVNLYLLSGTFGFHKFEQINEDSDKSIHLISWNVNNFLLSSDTVRKSADFIKKYRPDIICFQERPHTSLLSCDSICSILNYAHVVTNSREDEVLNLAILSRWKLTDLREFYFSNSYNKFVQVDVHYPNGTFRLFNVHLQTTGANDFIEGNLFSVLQQNAKYRYLQAEQLRTVISESPYPVIICGDMNDVPFSYTYTQVKSNLQDCFLEKGIGWGGSIQSLRNLYRIDYIFCSKHFDILDYQLFSNKWSDHKIQYTEVQLLPTIQD